MNDLDPSWLRSFDAIARTGSITRAAMLVHRTQSAVSMQLQQLENAVGVRLVERSTRALALTEQGERLLPHARGLIDAQREAHAAVVPQPTPTVWRIGISEYFLPGRLGELLDVLQSSAPHVRFELLWSGSMALKHLWDAEQVDLVVVLGDFAGLGARLLRREPLAWVVAPGHSPSPGASAPLVLLGPDCPVREKGVASAGAIGSAPPPAARLQREPSGRGRDQGRLGGRLPERHGGAVRPSGADQNRVGLLAAARACVVFVARPSGTDKDRSGPAPVGGRADKTFGPRSAQPCTPIDTKAHAYTARMPNPAAPVPTLAFIGAATWPARSSGGWLPTAGRGRRSSSSSRPRYAVPNSRWRSACAPQPVAMPGWPRRRWWSGPSSRRPSPMRPRRARPHVGNALHLSVMAGIRIEAIAAATGAGRIVRAMPNTPAADRPGDRRVARERCGRHRRPPAGRGGAGADRAAVVVRPRIRPRCGDGVVGFPGRPTCST